MNGSKNWRGLLVGLTLAACLGATGCQVQMGGQTLPNANYLSDDVQLYAPAAEMKLSREAAAMKARQTELATQQTQK